jgi:replicative DNA helicase
MNLERQFIANILLKPELTGDTAIRPADLQDEMHAIAYASVLKLQASGVTPDQVVVAQDCQDYTNDIIRLTPESKNFEYYNRELCKQIERRRLTNAAMVFKESLDNGDDPGKVLERVESMIAGAKVEHEQHEIKTLHSCAMEFGPIFEKRYKAKGELVGIPTGFAMLDGILGGFQNGTYYIGARPSQGKTALMLTMMLAACNAGYGAGLISIESSEIELISRVIAQNGPIRASGLKSGSLLPSEFQAFSASIDRLKSMNGQIYFNTKTDIPTLENVARRMVKTHGTKIIFIDYLQRVNAKGYNKTEQVTAASRAVTDIAKGIGVPVVCLAQTGRIADQETPALNHFQHASAIEQDADVAMVIHHPMIEGEERSELAVLKNRDGEVGSVPVYFDRSHVRFLPRETSQNQHRN